MTAGRQREKTPYMVLNPASFFYPFRARYFGINCKIEEKIPKSTSIQRRF
jgi:hypothetical protein